MTSSVFDLFKLGVGPSSSHTLGPMTAAGRWLARLDGQGVRGRVAHVEVVLYGSLVIATMKRTGEDMKEICKETSLGGLAVNAIEC